MKIILILEDTPDELEKAKRAVKSRGYTPLAAMTLDDAFRLWSKFEEKVTGLLTDLHVPKVGATSSLNDHPENVDKPCGLAAVARAVQIGVPVSVCSDAEHHLATYVEEILKALAAHPNYGKYAQVPITLDRKDWKQALDSLEQLINKEVTV